MNVILRVSVANLLFSRLFDEIYDRVTTYFA